MLYKEIDYGIVKEYLSNCSPESKIYLGADSERVKIDGVWHVDVLTCLIVHIDGKHGGKMFGQVKRERDYDKALNKPQLRMMMETYAVAEMYLRFAELITPFEIEIHLDIASDPRYGSNCAHNQAVGYIKGVCGMTPITKPASWCASICADRIKSELIRPGYRNF